jgi:hypothetical protein
MGEAVAYQSFPLVSGEYVQMEFTVRDNDNAVVDLTAGTGRFAAARTPSDTVLVLDSAASPANATVQVVDPLTGRVNVLITDEVTEPLIGDYYWELKWTDIAGREATVARGIMSFAANLI